MGGRIAAAEVVGAAGPKTAIAKILACPWQRSTVHIAHNKQDHGRRSDRGLVAVALREVFDASSLEAAREGAGVVIERFRGTVPKIAELLEAADEDLLAFYRFPTAHWSKLRSTPLERVNREIGRRSDVVGIFPHDASAIRLAGALLIEQNDEWLVSRRYPSEESMIEFAPGILGTTMRYTNRPSGIQQIISFNGHRP